MIGTIGALVQESSNRWRWLLSASLYTLACVCTSLLLGTGLGVLGHLLQGWVHMAAFNVSYTRLGAWVIGLLALAYAVSDLGWLPMPRPTLAHAVPITWWRWWRPYGASLAYGAALGLGITTFIPFGAFYVICGWCILKGDPLYGALLLGTYGAMRALVIFPISWGLHCRHQPVSEWGSGSLFNQWRAQQVVAFALIMFGTLVLISSIW